MFGGYRYIAAAGDPTEKGRGAQMYQDFDRGLGRERLAQMRKEVAHNRLEILSAQTARSDVDGVVSRGSIACGAALVTTLLR